MSETDVTQQGDRAWSQLRTAIGDFLMEFATLESFVMTEVICALIDDPTLVKHLEELLDLEKKTTLIRRLIEHYALSIRAPLVNEVKSILNAVKKLQERRNEVAHNTSALLRLRETTSAGVQRTYSKRPLPTKSLGIPGNFENWVASCVHSREQIATYARDAVALRERLLAVVPQFKAALAQKPPGRLFKLVPDS